MYVHRDVEGLFDKLANVYNILAIVGARQAGKTTLVKKKLEEYVGNYISLDDPDARELFNEDVKKFEKAYIERNKITCIDEIQYGREAGIKLKYLADKGYKLWVTSSSEILISKEILSYLVGRVSIIRLYPFSLNEFVRARNIKSLTNKIKRRVIWEHISYGGYPKVVLTEDVEIKRIILRDLLETMLLKDVSMAFSIDNIYTLDKLTKYLAINIGKPVSYENITSLLEVSFQTLKKYLDALEKSYVIKRIYPFYTNKTKELSKRPKIYFIDTGLRNMILKEFLKEPEGSVFENYVLTELLKAGFSVRYWRTKAGAEVDFVLEKNSEVIPIEVKSKITKIGRSMKSFIKTYKPEKAFLVFYRGKERKERHGETKVYFMDLFELLSRI